MTGSLHNRSSSYTRGDLTMTLIIAVVMGCLYFVALFKSIDLANSLQAEFGLSEPAYALPLSAQVVMALLYLAAMVGICVGLVHTDMFCTFIVATVIAATLVVIQFRPHPSIPFSVDDYRKALSQMQEVKLPASVTAAVDEVLALPPSAGNCERLAVVVLDGYAEHRGNPAPYLTYLPAAQTACSSALKVDQYLREKGHAPTKFLGQKQ